MNWGHRLTIATISFMGFIIFLVISSTLANKDLVAQDYYDQEVNYQERINSIDNGNKIKALTEIKNNRDFVQISLPESINLKAGTAYFYRSNDATQDKTFKLLKNSSKQVLDVSKMNTGIYKLKLEFKDQEKTYFIEQQINLSK